MAVFATFTAASMDVASSAFGLVLSRKPVSRQFAALARVLGLASLVFGACSAGSARSRFLSALMP